MIESDVQTLNASDYQTLIDFLNRAFGFTPDTGFPHLLPARYRPDDAHMRCQYALRDADRLAAVAGLFPIDWNVAGESLRIAGIGGVSVASEYRGQGLMRRLIEHIIREAKSQQCDLAYLGGQRQLYQRFGWEKAGCDLQYRLTPENIQHAHASSDSPSVTLSPLPDADASDLARKLKTLHDAQLFHCERPAHFLSHLRDSRTRCRFAVDRHHQPLGYIVWNPQQRLVTELIAQTPHLAFKIAALLVREVGELWISMSPGQVMLQQQLGRTAEEMRCGIANSWQIFNWPRVLQTLLRVKHLLSPLPPGRVVLNVADVDETFAIEVTPRGVVVQTTHQVPDLSADAATLTQLLCGPLPAYHVHRLPAKASLLAAWAPLPLYISAGDRV